MQGTEEVKEKEKSEEGDLEEAMAISLPLDLNLEDMENNFDMAINKTMSKVNDLHKNSLPSRLIMKETSCCRTVQWMVDLEGKSLEEKKTDTAEEILFSNDKELIIASFNYLEMDSSPPSNTPVLTFKKRIFHEARVDMARCMPQSKNIIATQSIDIGEILIFDSEQPIPNIEIPIYRFEGHTQGGSALSWSPIFLANLLSGSIDGTIKLWDLKLSKLIKVWESNSPVNDVQWFPLEPSLFGSVHQDSNFSFWDIRLNIPHKNTVAHILETTALRFHPIKPHLFLTGSKDETVSIWDLRNVTTKIHSINAKVGEVRRIEWLPYEQSMFAVCGSNGSTQIFNLLKTGMEDYSIDQESISRDSMFLDKGSGEPILDLACHPHNRGLISTAVSNTVSAWKVPSAIWEDQNSAIESAVHGGIQALLNLPDEVFDLN